MFINKTTAVWLLQVSERVSTDRLFRVRACQPYNTVTVPQPRTCKADNTLPVVEKVLEVDDVCVFKHTAGKWKIGRILQFAHYL